MLMSAGHAVVQSCGQKLITGLFYGLNDLKTERPQDF